jgi:hypothetical protein
MIAVVCMTPWGSLRVDHGEGPLDFSPLLQCPFWTFPYSFLPRKLYPISNALLNLGPLSCHSLPLRSSWPGSVTWGLPNCQGSGMTFTSGSSLGHGIMEFHSEQGRLVLYGKSRGRWETGSSFSNTPGLQMRTLLELCLQSLVCLSHCVCTVH